MLTKIQRTKKYFFVIIVLILLITDINVKTVNAAASTGKTSILNNGGHVVKYQGQLYYWQYNAKSFEKDALWGNYTANYNINNKMIRIDKSGKKQIIFSECGSGKIFINNNRIFLQGMNKEKDPIIFSVDMNGKNRKDYGTGIMQAIDEKSGMIIYNPKAYDSLSTLNCKNGLKKDICKRGMFLALDNGTVFYQDYTGKGSVGGNIQLKSYSINSNKSKLILQTKPDSYDKTYENTAYNIVQFEVNGNDIYFSYGVYSGTAFIYQGGRIVHIKQKENTHEILAGKNGNWVDSTFYLLDNKQGKSLIYHQLDDKNMSLSLKTGKLEKTDLVPHEVKVPFQEGENISVYLDNQGIKTQLIRKEDYKEINPKADLKKGFDETYLNLYKVELIDHSIFYMAEYSTHNPKIDIGWRYGYTRKKTNHYQKDLKSSKKTLLYTY